MCACGHWALQVEEFDCNVVHRWGSAIRYVEALSRYPAVLQVQDTLLEQVKECYERSYEKLM